MSSRPNRPSPSPEEPFRHRQSAVELELVDWRRATSQLYADVRDEHSPAAAHALWRAGRDRLFREHPQSPLPDADRLRDRGLPYWPYDPGLRFELPVIPIRSPTRISLATGADGVTTLRSVGYVQLPPPVDSRVDVWWVEQYGGGLFLPLRDGTAGETTYGGGRYLLDTAKGADLGSTAANLIVDLNFLYHPSCRYDHRWQCPLPPPANTISVRVHAGERMSSRPGASG